MAAEIRAILTAAVDDRAARNGLFPALVDRFARLGGVDLELPSRDTRPRAAVLPE